MIVPDLRGSAAIVGAYEHPLRHAPDKSEWLMQAESLDDAGLEKSDVDAFFTVAPSPEGGYVRETHTLNSGLVFLTISIAGGPFMGLLGTVVGVMITFAAIAATGEVNISAIAPGLAAALVVTSVEKRMHDPSSRSSVTRRT